MVQAETVLYEDFRLKTAGEIFFSLQAVTNVEDIKKLKPEGRTQRMLRSTANLAV